MSCMSRENRNPFMRNKQNFALKDKRQLYCARYYNYFLNLALQRYEYEGFPDEILPQFIERILFEDGKICFFYDEVAEKYAVMRVNLSGMPDIYGIPNRRDVYANTYYRSLNKENSVIGFSNYTEYPEADIVFMHANSLALMRMTRDINIFAQRTPVMIAATADSNLTTSNILNQYAEFVPFIQMDGRRIEDMDKAIRALDLHTPVVFDKIQVAMKQEKSECLTFLGIDSNATEKGERMISNEVMGNNGEIEANRQAGLSLRERFLDNVNRVFGLNVKVRFRSNIPITPVDIDKLSTEERPLGTYDGIGGERNVDGNDLDT